MNCRIVCSWSVIGSLRAFAWDCVIVVLLKQPSLNRYLVQHRRVVGSILSESATNSMLLFDPPSRCTSVMFQYTIRRRSALEKAQIAISEGLIAVGQRQMCIRDSRKDRPDYATILHQVTIQGRLFQEYDDDTIPCECTE